MKATALILNGNPNLIRRSVLGGIAFGAISGYSLEFFPDLIIIFDMEGLIKT